MQLLGKILFNILYDKEFLVPHDIFNIVKNMKVEDLENILWLENIHEKISFLGRIQKYLYSIVNHKDFTIKDVNDWSSIKLSPLMRSITFPNNFDKLRYDRLEKLNLVKEKYRGVYGGGSWVILTESAQFILKYLPIKSEFINKTLIK